MKITFKLLFLGVLMASCGKETTSTPTPTPPSIPTVTSIVPTGWKTLQNYAGMASLAGTTVAIGDKIYAGLGYSDASGYNNVTKTWYEYDPATDKWTRKSDFPGLPRANAIGLAINGKAYVGLGTNYNRVNREDLYDDFYEYDPATDKWTAKAIFTGTLRDQPAYFVIGNKGYFGTGNTPPSAPLNTKEFWEYDASANKWTRKADFAGAAVCRAFGFSLNSKGYIGGGEDNNVMKVKEVYEYDPATNTWAKKADLPDATSRARGFSFNNIGYMVGGLAGDLQSESSYNAILRYTPATNTWEKVSDLATDKDTQKGRFYPLVASATTKVFIGAGGYGQGTSPSKKSDFYEYIPK